MMARNDRGASLGRIMRASVWLTMGLRSAVTWAAALPDNSQALNATLDDVGRVRAERRPLSLADGAAPAPVSAAPASLTLGGVAAPGRGLSAWSAAEAMKTVEELRGSLSRVWGSESVGPAQRPATGGRDPWAALVLADRPSGMGAAGRVVSGSEDAAELAGASRASSLVPMGMRGTELATRLTPNPVAAGKLLLVDLGRIDLAPNQAGQWVTLNVQNVSGGPIEVSGLNFSLQIADTGPASEGGFGEIDGPNIQAVDLVTGTVFDQNSPGTQIGGGPPQAGSWSTTTSSGTVVLEAGSTTRIANVQFDTTGLPSTGSWSVLLALDVPALPLNIPTTYTDPVGQEILVNYVVGEVVVPEPWAVSLVSGLGLAGWLAVRRWRQAHPPRSGKGGAPELGSRCRGR
jgi:hypothetical protein